MATSASRGVRFVPVLVLAGGLSVVGACREARQVSVVAPTCAPAVALGASTFGPAGGTASAAVTAGDGCQWSASTAADWVSITSNATGRGNGTVAFSVAAFQGTEPRSGSISLAGQSFVLKQNACSVTLAVSDLSVASTQSHVGFDIVTQDSCRWSLEADAPWIATESPSGVGSGQATISVAENRDDARVATLRVNGLPLRVAQAAGPCEYTVSVSLAAFPVAGGTGVAHVQTRASCEWRLESTEPWIPLAGASSGRGSADVPFRVDANGSGPDRHASITLGANAAAISQLGQERCTYQVSPVQPLVASAGGSGDVAIVTQPGCEWTSRTTVPFLRINSASSGSGSGALSYTMDANPESYGFRLRKSAIEVRWAAPTAGQNVWVNQFTRCGVGLAPRPDAPKGLPPLTLDADGNRLPFFVVVPTPNGCPWNIVGAADWLQIWHSSRRYPDDPPGVGFGDGELILTALPNLSNQPRSVTLVMGEMPFTFTQLGRP